MYILRIITSIDAYVKKLVVGVRDVVRNYEEPWIENL